MKGAGWFAVGAVAATVLVTRIKKADPSTCCQRVNYGARDTIAGKAGPFAFLVSGAIDALGLTSHLSGLLDTLGVPTDGP